MAKALQIANVKFDPKAFDALLKLEGIDLILHKTAICPNRKSLDEESHNINCTFCDNGVVAYEEIEFTGMIHTSGVDKIFRVEGSWLGGSAMLTAPHDVRFDYFDIIEVPLATARYNQLMERGTTNIDTTKYPMKEILYIADSNNKKYGLDADYELTNNGKIKWISTNRPEDGQIYTVSYKYNPKFRVLEHLHFIRDMKVDSDDGTENTEHRQLPQQVLIRIDYLSDSNKDGNVND